VEETGIEEYIRSKNKNKGPRIALSDTPERTEWRKMKYMDYV